jgi:hypothetical protein
MSDRTKLPFVMLGALYGLMNCLYITAALGTFYPLNEPFVWYGWAVSALIFARCYLSLHRMDWMKEEAPGEPR